jgi:hypothetical protein
MRRPIIRSTTPLSLEQVAEWAPAVITTKKAPTLFDVYEHVNSVEIIKALMDCGYGISGARQINPRSDQFGGMFNKHIVQLRPLTAFTELHAGEYIPEIVFVGAHDGSSAVHMNFGLFRVICSNGMMVCEHTWSSVRIPHKRGAEALAVTAALELTAQIPKVDALVATMRDRHLSPDEARAFAKKALALRYEQPDAYDPGVLLMQRRLEDAGNDLWKVLNRIQENIMKGGFAGPPGPKGRVTLAPEITRIRSDVSINQGLWKMAEELLEM